MKFVYRYVASFLLLGLAITQVQAFDFHTDCGSGVYTPGTSGPGYSSGSTAGPQDRSSSGISQPSSRPGSQDYLAMGLGRGNYLTSSISPTGVGVGVAAAMNAIQVDAPRPFISPGLLTSANTEGPYALDRLFFNYSYYDRFQVLFSQSNVNPADPNDPAQVTTSRGPGFNLNRYDIGIEKTILGGMASLYLRGPFLDATNNISGVAIDGPGNVNAGIKVQLLHDERTGNILSAGLTVAAPTARDTVFTQSIMEDDADPNTPPVFVNLRINPTYLQPWISTQLNYDRLFIQGFLGVLVPDDDRVVTTINSNIALGYLMYENRYGTITSISPNVNVQVWSPVHDSDALIDFSDQVFLTPGVQIGLGENVSVGGGIAVPVAGPKAFDVGATGGINYLF